VFGEQISTYLREAAAERAQLEQDLLEEQPAADVPVLTQLAPTVMEQPPREPDVVESVQPWTAGPVADQRPIELDVVEPIQPWVAHSVDELPIEPDAVEPVRPWTADPVDDTPLELEEPLIDLSDELAELSDEDGSELFDGDPVGVYTIALEPDEPAIEAFDLSPTIQEPAAVAQVRLEPALTEPLDIAPSIETVYAEPTIDIVFAEPAPAVFAESAIETLFAAPPEPPRADIAEWAPMYLSPGRMWPALEGMPAEVPTPRTEQPDWIELVASLRQDLERRGTRPSDGASAETKPLVRKQRLQPKKEKPVQDEWGFFDPEQCGFSTLLAKLEEITDEVRP
jgi:hypothetical protein